MDEHSTNWVPSRKWAVAQIAALGGIVTMFITTGTWDQEESVAAVTWVVQAASTYLIPNKPDTSVDKAP